MGTISKGTELFSVVLAGAICFEDTNFPGEFMELKNFYGDMSGAANAPLVKKYLSGQRIGIATERPKEVVGGKTYQHLITQVEERSISGFLGWGSGEYMLRDAGIWVNVADITTDRTEAAKLEYERVNAAKIAKEKANQALLNSVTDPNLLGNGGGEDDKKSTSIWVYLIGFFAATGAGLFFYQKNSKKKQNIRPYQPKQQFTNIRL